jgi:hypothetical protein
MKIELKTAAIAAMMMLAALTASAETASPMVSNDPLMKQIMSRQLTQITGGVTGAVRIGSGQAITLSMIDPLAPLQPAEGLVEKPAPAPARTKASRKPRRADEQLKKMSDDKRAADWAGRK